MWTYYGQVRPDFADTPGPGQESVWDYPRPPALAADARVVRVLHQGRTIAETTAALRVLETASPPGFYIPPEAVNRSLLAQLSGSSFCEWKGAACYFGMASDEAAGPVAWSYPEPRHEFAALAGYFSFYAGRVECYVAGERVRPQPGGFYGGWLTDDIAGPVKGAPGTGHW